MIRNAAIGLSPDLSIAVVGAPIYATATDTSKCDSGDTDQQQRRQQHENQEHQLPPTHQKERQEITYYSHSQQQARLQPEHPSQIGREQTSRRRSTSSGLEALLSVTAQRRREEELALLRGLSDHGAMSHTG